MKIIALFALLLSLNTFSQQSIESDVIDIDGSYGQREMTPAEKLKKLRKKLEKQNEMMVKKQIENMRLQQEMEMTRKIQKAFDENMKKLENI